MSSLRPELHVAQQIRRDKLRFHNTSSSSSSHQHLQLLQDQFPNNNNNNLEHLYLHPGFNLDLVHVRNDHNNDEAAAAALYSSSEMIPHHHHHYASSSSTTTTTSLIHSSPKEDHHHQSGNWRNSSDWMVNYATTSNSMPNNQTMPFELNNNSDIVVTDPQSSYQNALQDIFKSASLSSSHTSEMASLMHHHQSGHGIWGGNNNPSYTSHQANLWTNRTVVEDDNNIARWNSFNNNDKKINQENVLSDFSNHMHPQGLSLSLSSNSHNNPNPSAPSHHFELDPHQSRSGIISRHVKSIQDPIMGMMPSSSNTSSAHRNVGPLGPFTGYATILKSSRFLKPCQELLEECCSRCRAALGGGSSASAVDVGESWIAEKHSDSGASSSTMFYNNSNGNNSSAAADGGGGSGGFCLSTRLECLKNKAKLQYMQEEVSRRYKQYHQQMQMVVSSFESVAGLSSATPYISLALKSVSRHFRCLKNAITNQLKLICEVLGEDHLSIPTTSTTGKKLDTNMTRLRCMDQTFHKNKSNIDSLEPQQQQQHVWRPQRGLPDRAVAVLKAWLFEHFLHPYPTDTDKHMLANQTGLSRNQVSNWFINARVRVWKPMVEEIHMLETKDATTVAANQNQNNSNKNEGTSCASEGSSSRKFEEKGLNEEEQWNQEKRSRLECGMTSSMDHGTLMGFMPYRHGGVGGGGLGSVSLTLGLMHGVEDVQYQQQQQQLQQQQQQQQQQQLRPPFGGHMIHDFVG
ncbi:hypothetical protein RIF29_31843 [Crotalaria pallida]|uniref:Homeobox domain-containing protein n=1 Tax=Crotalaria pallida TaxID=3830 RepID=A0AAN9EJV1_CROPI